MKNLLLLLVLLLLTVSCVHETATTQEREIRAKVELEIIAKEKAKKIKAYNDKSYPKKYIHMQKFEQYGMTYMVLSKKRSTSGGVDVVNLTLDKAKLEYYKQNTK